MKIKGNNGNFEICPEFSGKAVCVDVTPLRKQQSQYGERDVFKLVMEVDVDKDDGSRFCVWSQNFTPSLNEKANFRKFLRSWFGRDLMESEMGEFDTETLIGKPAQVVVVHEHKEGQVYANIAACTPDKSGAPLKSCGKFTRRKDRDGDGVQGSGFGGQGRQGEEGSNQSSVNGNQNGSGGSGYRRAQGAGEAGGAEHGAVKVHVGKCAGIELRDLAAEQVQALVANWLPGAKANPKPLADDKRLMAALEWWAAAREKANDNVPY